MDGPRSWHLWSADEIAEALPALIALVEARFDELPSEHYEKNREALDALKADPPTPGQIRDGTKSLYLGTVGFALDVLGRRAARAGDHSESLRLFQAAHELFRRGNPLLRATRPMRQTVGNALRVLVAEEVRRCGTGETHAGAVKEALHAFVTSAWGLVPPQLPLTINELILLELERVRAGSEGDPEAEEALVRDNIEALLGLEMPTRLERIRRQWEEIAERVAPAVVRRAQRTVRRPEPLLTLIPQAIWVEIGRAVEQGDADLLGQALADVRDELETNLRLRLDAKPEYREPASEIRLTGGPDPAFLQARELLLRRDPRALEEFGDLHYRRSANTIAKEWYAYALTLFGRATDIHDVIDLLEAAIASDRFHEHRGWTARWNLACALRRLPSRADEALDVLLPVVETDSHLAEVFELCLLWALEQGRQDVLATLCLKARAFEAHLLAALQDAESPHEPGAATRFREHFRRINRILRDPDRLFPDPRERLLFEELDQLTRDFIETSMVAAGIEWFRERVAYGYEGGVFKNWECAAVLNEEAGDLAAAWRCRVHSWRSTQHKRNVDPRKKTQLLRGLLAWAQRHDFREEGFRILRQSWRDTAMSEADARLWEERLGAGLSVLPGEPAGPGGPAGARDPVLPADGAADPDSARAVSGRALTSSALRASSRPDAPGAATGARRAALALMLDWENIKISLSRHLDELGEARAEALRSRLSGVELASRLNDQAWRHGLPRQRWAVADWDRPFFEGDQKALRNARFSSEIAGTDKSNASDHVLREKIHFVLRHYPEVAVYVIGTGDGDFHEVIQTLQREGKQVILWSTRRAVSEAFGESLRGPDRIRVEWLEDLVFGEDVQTS
jgi:hypothetical protein